MILTQITMTGAHQLAQLKAVGNDTVGRIQAKTLVLIAHRATNLIPNIELASPETSAQTSNVLETSLCLFCSSACASTF